jgi:hypothetical protein
VRGDQFYFAGERPLLTCGVLVYGSCLAADFCNENCSVPSRAAKAQEVPVRGSSGFERLRTLKGRFKDLRVLSRVTTEHVKIPSESESM